MLSAKQLTWQKNGTSILQGVDFLLKQGERVGLVGPNGSGKSSLLKMLSFLETPTSGELKFQGSLIAGKVPLEIRRKIAVVFQEPLLFDTTVYENAASGLKIRGVAKSEIQLRVEEWLTRFGVEHLSKQQARSLSGGEAQRVNLARAFVLQPEILFLDEPFSAMDAPTKELLLVDLVDILNLTKITTVLVSHDFREIQRFTQRAAVIINGRIHAEGLPTDLLREPQPPAAAKFLSLWSNQHAVTL
jgi:tungstate transport system ATP-binding protein